VLVLPESLNQFVGLGQVSRQWFFSQNVFSGLGCLDNDLGG
jgi:hypothetical protein